MSKENKPANQPVKATLFAHVDVDKSIDDALKAHGDAGKMVAIAIIAALGHALVYGNADRLNRLYDGASKYQPEMLEFVRKINNHPCGNQGTIAPQKASIFKFEAKSKRFSVLSDRLKVRQYLAHFSINESNQIAFEDGAQDATVETLRQIWESKPETKAKTETAVKKSAEYLLGQFKTMRNKIGTTYADDDTVAVEYYNMLTGFVAKLEKQVHNMEAVTAEKTAA